MIEQQPGFIVGHGGRVHFEGPLAQGRKVKFAVQAGEKVIELLERERGGSAAAKEDRLAPQFHVFIYELKFTKKRVKERLRLIPIRGFFVKTAIRADLE